MFFPEQIKKITQLKDSEGFLYFNPQEEVESSLGEEERETSSLRNSLNKQHQLFLVLKIIMVVLHILAISFWGCKIDKIYNYENLNETTLQYKSHLSTYIMVLMVIHFIWILNSLLGYMFLRYELNFGIIFYFVTLNVILFTRIAVTLLVLVSSTQVIEMIGSFSPVLYLLLSVVQLAGDVMLTVLAARMKYYIKKLITLVDKKLYSEPIYNITVFSNAADLQQETPSKDLSQQEQSKDAIKMPFL